METLVAKFISFSMDAECKLTI